MSRPQCPIQEMLDMFNATAKLLSSRGRPTVVLVWKGPKTKQTGTGRCGQEGEASIPNVKFLLRMILH